MCPVVSNVRFVKSFHIRQRLTILSFQKVSPGGSHTRPFGVTSSSQGEELTELGVALGGAGESLFNEVPRMASHLS